MTTVVGIVGLMALFLVFPLINRERGPRECGSGGCWKKKVSFGCGMCPQGTDGTTVVEAVDPVIQLGVAGGETFESLAEVRSILVRALNRVEGGTA